MNDYEKILQIAKQNNGMFKTKMIVDAGIRKERLKKLLEIGEIKQICRGYYSLIDNKTNRYYEFQQRCPKSIFSYRTSAHLWGMTDTEPDTLDCTVPRGYNTTNLKINENVKYHYVIEEYYEIGLTEKEIADGIFVKLYDRERTICDFIKSRRQLDRQLYSSVLNTYFKSREKDISKLAKYGRQFHVINELEMYMEIL